MYLLKIAVHLVACWLSSMAVPLEPFMTGTVEGLTKPWTEGVRGRDVDWLVLVVQQSHPTTIEVELRNKQIGKQVEKKI